MHKYPRGSLVDGLLLDSQLRFFGFEAVAQTEEHERRAAQQP